MIGARHVAAPILASAIAVAVPTVARADLAAEAARVVTELKADGALVEPASHFLFVGEVEVLRPLDAIASSDACVTLVLLGERGTQFAVTRSEADAATPARLIDASLHDKSAVEASNEGLYVHTACGAELSRLSTVVVRMRSPRGAVESIVARSTLPPKAIDALLTVRSRGAGPADPVAFDPMAGGPVDDRKRRVAERARGRGATNLASVTMQASATGTGEFDLRVARGCHAFDVVADAERADVDATLTHGDGASLADDDAEAPDAHLETCLPEGDDVVLQYSGAGAASAVTVLDAVFAWPKWITERWGVRAATGLARVVFASGAGPAPTDPPVLEILGGPGTMVVHPNVEPGRCYLATLAITRGTSRGLRLTASASSRVSIDQASLPGDAVTVSFCSEDMERARVQVEAPSLSNAWVLSIYALGSTTEASP